MDRSSIYSRQVSLLIRCIPIVSTEECFALKDGTAINLFVKDFPRLSVDIDLAYLLSHNRPIAEVMNPRWKDISTIYDNEFVGMTFEQVSLGDLIQTQNRMTESLRENFTQKDHDFLISFKSGEPDWRLSPNENIQNLSAVQWKLLNIRKMPEKKHQKSLARLETVLSDWLVQS